MPVFVCLFSSCYHVTGRRAIQFVRLILQVVMQNGRDYVDVILILTSRWKVFCPQLTFIVLAKKALIYTEFKMLTAVCHWISSVT